MPEAPSSLKYQRVLLKVSGEFFSGEQGSIDPVQVSELARRVIALTCLGVEVAVVLGAGNLCRGHAFAEVGFDQVAADRIGMLATVMNALALKDTLRSLGQTVALRGAFAVEGMVKKFERDEAIDLLSENKVLICAGGTGNPLVTTDTTAALRAIELRADILLKATKVDGVYSADPVKDKAAVLFSELRFDEVISKKLNVMDLSAFSLAREHHLPVRVFNMQKSDVFERIVLGENEGTLVH